MPDRTDDPIEKLKQLQAQLYELVQSDVVRQRQVRSILDSVTDAYCALDRNWNVTNINRVCQELFKKLRIPSNHIQGKVIWDVIPDVVGSSIYNQLQNAMVNEVSVEFEEYIPGSDIWFEFHVNPTEDGLSVYFKEITERKRIIERLCDTEVRYRSLADTASDPIITIDQESKIIFANKATERVFGYSEDELTGQSLTLLMPENLRERHLLALQRYKESGLKQVNWERAEFPGRHKNGSIIPLEISFSESTQQGKAVFTGILRDITDRKKAEDTLKKSELSFRLMFANNPNPMWVFDLETFQFLEVNQAASKHYGYTRDEFLKMKEPDLHASGNANKFVEQIKKAPESLTFSGHWRHRLKNNRIIDVQVTANLISFSDRPAIMMVCQDITERRKEDRRMRQSLEGYKLLFDANPEVMYVFDVETLRFLVVNKATLARYGYTEGEFMKMTIKDIRPAEDIQKLEDYLRETSDDVRRAGVWRHRKKDGTILWVDITDEPIAFAGHKCKLVIAKEVTEIAKANQQGASNG